MGKGEEKACFLWQHEHGRKWITYSAEELEVINKAFNKKQKTVTLPGGTATKQITVNFDDMVQKNKVSGWEQRIKCCLFDDDSFYVWQWKDDDGFWYSYIPGVALELESCYKQGKEKLSFYLHEADYEVNLKDMCQKNEKTGKSRSVKRAKIAVTKAEKALLTVAVGSKSAAQDNDSDDKNKNGTEDESGPSSKKKRKMTEAAQEENICTKTLVFKGKVPVDPECTEKVGKAHVYFDGTNVYDAMLNQTNLQYNNNKYYVLQVLEDDNCKKFSVWFRWGRVGKRGQSNLLNFGTNLDGAVKEFTKKFYDKTRNEWIERDHFVKVSGKYDLLKMDYSTEDSTAEKPAKKKSPPPQLKSKLDPKVLSLVELICNIKLMEETVVEMKYDAKKAPLGKLTVEQIKAGYVALKKIEDIIRKNGKGSQLVQACNDFYTRIPHDFGMKTPPLIQTTEQIKLKMEMLEALGDIQIAIKMLSDELGANQHPADSHYEALQCKLKPMDKESSTFKMLEQYMQDTHAETHRNYSIEVLDIFECDKEGEKDRFKDIGNRTLLWHGSRLTNFVGILKQGLRIAPPEAPSTGYMFGKGVYFADMCSKSANYCYATRSKNEGLMLLCEVALGESNKLINADYEANKLPKGKHSVMGLGRVAPDPKGTTEMEDGVKVHLGKPCDTELESNFFSLNYNEYIVYNVNQIKMRYLFRIKFHFK